MFTFTPLDKKMNLSASQDELERDNYYIRERSPDPQPISAYGDAPSKIVDRIGRGPMPMHHPGPKAAYSPPPHPHQHPHQQHPHKYGGNMPPRPGPGPVPFDEDPYGRSLRYRELPPHRMPQYEDEMIKRRIRPAREVIVQRVEPAGRGDEWMDPWMRSKSPGRGDREKRQKRERRSYSSNSSYSSSRYALTIVIAMASVYTKFCELFTEIKQLFFFVCGANQSVILRHSLAQVRIQVDQHQHHGVEGTIVRLVIKHQFVADMSNDPQHQKCIRDATHLVSHHLNGH